MSIQRRIAPLLVWLLAVPAAAQHPLHRLGVSGQALDGAMPFEQVDPLSGNLVISATDLVLPGNAGFDLRVQRFYNSALYPGYATGDLTIEEDSWAGIGWRLHFGRVLHASASGSGETQIEMGDGSRHPLYTTGAFAEGWITRDFWLYDRQANTLKLPNGLVYTFARLVHLNDTLGDVRYVTEMRDVYGNRIEFTYFDEPGPVDGVARIKQFLSPTQRREITFTYDAALKSLATMQYGTRVWRYEQVPTGRPGFSLLRFVRPPAGPPWAYEYSPVAPGEELNKVLAPLGGTVSYTFADITHRTGAVSTVTRAVATRTLGGRYVDPATWTYSFAAGANQDQTVVTSPCAVTRYRFLGVGVTGDFSPVTAGALAERTTESGGTILERETFSYAWSEAVSPDFVPGDEGITSSNGVFNALLAQRSITRGSQTWTTTYTYRAGLGTFNDYGQPSQVEETDRPYHVRSTTNTYDHAFTPYIRGRLALQSTQVRFAYNQFSGPEESRWTYDHATGFLTAQTALGTTTTFEARSDGNVAASVDALNHRTTYEYDWGRVSQVSTPVLVTTSTVNPDGTVAWSGIGTRGVAYSYDEAFRLRTVTPTGGLATSIDFDDIHGTEVLTRRGTLTAHTRLGGFGGVYETEGPDGVKVRQVLDSCGRGLTFQSAPFTAGDGSRGTSTVFDPLGRPTQITDPAGGVTTLQYDGIDVTVTDPEQRVTHYDYDAFGGPVAERLAAVTDPLNERTTYDYNALNQLVKVVVPGVPPRTWTYAEGRLIDETQPESGNTTYSYYATGQLETATNALLEVTSFEYYADGKLKKVDAPGEADDILITYDEWGQIKTRINGAVQTAFDYHPSGDIKTRTDTVEGHTFVSQYSYYDDGSLQTLTYPSGRAVTYEYDTVGRLATVKNNGQPFAHSFTYEHAGDFGDTGALASYQTGGVTHTFRLDAKSRIRQVTALNALSDGLDLTFAYDGADQVRAITDPRPGSSQSFTYDAVGRLSTAEGPWGTRGWSYDAAGNRLTETAQSAVTTYTYDSARQWLTSVGGPTVEQFGYDAAGRLRHDGRASYEYTGAGQLAAVAAPQIAAAYRYDGGGDRIVRTVNGVTTYTLRSASGEPLSEYRIACGNLVWTRDTIYAAGRPLGAVRANLDPPTVSMGAATLSVSEAAVSVAIPVRITTVGGAPTVCPVTVSYSTIAGTARTADVALPSGTLTIPAGTPSGTMLPVSIAILPDPFDEFDETFRLVLSSATGATITTPDTTEVTIVDDDPIPSIAIAGVDAVEADIAAVPMTFTVSLSAPSGKPVSVRYAFEDLAASAGADYVPDLGTYSGTLTLDPGVGAVSLRASVLPDLLDETPERFRITLSDPINATLATATALGTIIDNDPAVLSVGDVVVRAGQRARFTVSLSTPADVPITVRWGTADGTAQAGTDYGSQSGTVEFAVGESMHIVEVGTILDAPERDETFLASFYSATGPVVLPSAPATATIVHRKKGDLTGDGWPDLLWQHRTEGTVVVWTMEGTTRTGYPYLTPMDPGAGWEVAGVADFSNDGYQDVVFQDASGSIQIWTMHDLERTGILVPSATVGDANWRVRAAGDFNGDGAADLALHHQTTGELVLWLMQGATVTQAAPTSAPGADPAVWHLAAASDVNLDGKADLLWQDQVSGYLAAWLLDGATVLQSASLVPYQLQNLGWHLRAAGDFSGDGKPDLFWHHETDDYLTVWVMDGVTRTSNVTPTPYGVVAALWRLAGPR